MIRSRRKSPFIACRAASVWLALYGPTVRSPQQANTRAMASPRRQGQRRPAAAPAVFALAGGAAEGSIVKDCMSTDGSADSTFGDGLLLFNNCPPPGFRTVSTHPADPISRNPRQKGDSVVEVEQDM